MRCLPARRINNNAGAGQCNQSANNIELIGFKPIYLIGPDQSHNDKYPAVSGINAAETGNLSGSDYTVQSQYKPACNRIPPGFIIF